MRILACIRQWHENANLKYILWISVRKGYNVIETCYNLFLHFFYHTVLEFWKYCSNSRFYRHKWFFIVVFNWKPDKLASGRTCFSIFIGWLISLYHLSWRESPFWHYYSFSPKRFVNFYDELLIVSLVDKVQQKVNACNDLIFDSVKFILLKPSKGVTDQSPTLLIPRVTDICKLPPSTRNLCCRYRRKLTFFDAGIIFVNFLNSRYHLKVYVNPCQIQIIILQINEIKHVIHAINKLFLNFVGFQSW